MAKNKPQKATSKKHIARLERERRQVRAITIGALGVIIVVILLIGYSILDRVYLQAQQPIVKVDDTSVTTSEFQARVRLTRTQLINQYIQYYQFSQMFNMDFSQQLDQLYSELDNHIGLGSRVVDELINDLIIRKEAVMLGITITEEEIQEAIQASFAYFPEGTLTPTVTSTPPEYPTLSATQIFLLNPTATATPTQTEASSAIDLPTLTITPTFTATPTEESDNATAVTPTITPTSTPYTFDAFQQNYLSALADADQLGVSEEMYIMLIENQIYRRKLKDAITADLIAEQEMVWARHILVQDEATATLVLDELAKGKDWAELALEYSTDTSNNYKGGDLDWFGRGRMVEEFETAAFDLAIGEISEPVLTDFGWHIIQVLGHENRPLTAEEFSNHREETFQEWLASTRESYDIIIYDYWIDRVPKDPTLEEVFGQTFSQ